MTHQRKRLRPPRRVSAGAPPPERASTPASVVALVLALFAAVFATLQIWSYSQKSATWDEPTHLTSGYAALSGDYRIDPSHPPFIRMWAAIPLRALGVAPPDLSAVDDIPPREWLPAAYDLSRRFLYDENDADRLLYAGRFMIVLCGILLGVLLFGWAYEWLGFAPAVMILAFYTISPNLVAHASLVTTDLGAACFIFGTVYLLWRASRRVSAGNAIGLVVFCALAVVTKFSSLVLGPVIVLLLLAAVHQRTAVTIRSAGALMGALLLGTIVAVWAVYGFRYAPGPSSTWLFDVGGDARVAAAAPLMTEMVGWLDGRRLLPNAFSQGLLHGTVSVRDLRMYLMGDYSTNGWWHYFPVAFLVKTPAAFILLLAIGLVVLVRRRGSLGLVNIAFVAVPPAVYLAVAMHSGINIGLRHILPVYPFALLIAAAAAAELLASPRVAARAVLVTLTTLWIATFAAVYPHTLTFFNLFVGGPRNGIRYLADSNIDWGQHLKLLKGWMDRERVDHVNLAYFGEADPAYYNIDCTFLPGGPAFTADAVARPRLPGYVAISATLLTGVHLTDDWRLFYEGFREREPVANVGNSIRVYWIDEWPEPTSSLAALSADAAAAHAALADGLLFGLQWPDHAAMHYRRYLQHDPDDPDVLARHGLALAAAGQVGEATETLLRAIAIDSRNGMAHMLLARIFLLRGRAADALAHAERALTINPDDAEARDVWRRARAR